MQLTDQLPVELKQMSSCYKGITLDGKAVAIEVAGDKISSVEDIEKTPQLPRLFPVLVDLQHNGSLGTAYNELNESNRGKLLDIGEHLLRHGIGRVFATITTIPHEMLCTAAGTINSELLNNRLLDRLFCGIFHEGVFISPQLGWRGSHPPQFISPADWDKFQKVDESSGNRIKLVNVAPEEPGALEFISKAVAAGKKVALGHCCPGSDTIREAVDRGAGFVTHFGNGMAANIHRFKNPVWEFLSNESLTLGLIGDGFHLPPELVRTVMLAKGREKFYMVSDASALAGCPPGIYDRFGGMQTVIEENGHMHLPDQDVLSAAWFQNDHSVKFLMDSLGMSLEDAWSQCSTIPAGVMNIFLPDLRVGSEASFVVVEEQSSSWNIKTTIFCGQEY